MTSHPASADSARTIYRTPDDLPPARLALADGSVFAGRAFGATSVDPARPLVVEAEVVFNTAMTGYQESLTDPSYTGQILVQTTPLIGNTGVNPDDVESARVQVAGLIVHELTRRHANYRATGDLSAYLAHHRVPGLTGIDTRALTRLLRTTGSINGVLTDAPDSGPHAISDAQLVARARAIPSMAGLNLVPAVGCTTNLTWAETLGEWSVAHPPVGATPLRVLAIDCGAKRNILRHLTDRGCLVTVIPHDTPADRIAQMFDRGDFDGLFISNGPGDPAAVRTLVETLSKLIRHNSPAGRPIPTFGICLGHQLLALAAGARTYKLKFGHRGANQPVLAMQRSGPTGSGRVEITSQNHGFAVDRDSLEAAGGEVTHVHLNDHTVAGFRLAGRPIFSVQYHPEASPGPHDASELFDRFVDAMRAL